MDTLHSPEDTIRFALEAAEAANDASTEVETLKAAHARALERSEATLKRMQMLLGGAVGVTVAAVAVGAMLYSRSAADMKAVTQTNLQSLKVFTQSVDTLDASIKKIDALKATMTKMTAQTDGNLKAINAGLADMRSALKEELKAGLDRNGALAPQVATAIEKHMDTRLKTTNDAVTAAISDLGVAMQKMLDANGGAGGDTAAILSELKRQEKELGAIVASMHGHAPAAGARHGTRSRPRAVRADKPISYP